MGTWCLLYVQIQINASAPLFEQYLYHSFLSKYVGFKAVLYGSMEPTAYAQF